jgi:hypothetical protein
MKKTIPFLITAVLTLAASAESPKPLKALLVLGGCCHDYATQKNLLEAGIEARANVQVDVCYSPEKGTKVNFTCYEKENWAEGYDVIIHDECAADTKDLTVVNRILAPHRQGVPAVNLHCAMHSYRTAANVGKPVESGTDGSLWFDFLGLQSSGHGAQLPIEVSYLDPASPITRGLENWTTIKEELYNNVRIHDGIKPIARGKQGASETVIAWTNAYGEKKTRVFCTTLGHNNETVADSRYLDFVTRGLLWACDKVDPTGKPLPGYGAPTAITK